MPANKNAVIIQAGVLYKKEDVIYYSRYIILWLKVTAYQKKKNPEHEISSFGPLEGALLGLLSFTFNKSASNYDTRKQLIVQEYNDIGTALFRSDLYADSIANEFKIDFKQYITARIDYYKAGNNEKKILEALKKAEVISAKIWLRATRISQQSGYDTRSMQMIPAINNMIDTMSKREAARLSRVPGSILWLLLLLALTGSFIVGYAHKSKGINWIIIIAYSIMTVMTIYLILDLDRPRRGIINTGSIHKNMDKLFESLDQ